MAVIKTINIAASANICAKKSLFYGIIIATDGAEDVVANVYDDSATGTTTKIIPQLTIKAGDHYGGVSLPHPISCVNGIYVTLSGAGTENASILYKRG